MQIIRCGQAGVEQADDGKPHRASAHCGGEGIELAEEAARERNSDQRGEKEDEQGTEQR